MGAGKINLVNLSFVQAKLKLSLILTLFIDLIILICAHNNPTVRTQIYPIDFKI